MLIYFRKTENTNMAMSEVLWCVMISDELQLDVWNV